MREGRRNDLYRTERDSLEGSHEEAEIQRKALRLEKNLAFSEDTRLKKQRVRSKVTPRKVGVGLKRRREPSKRRLGYRLPWWGSTEKKEGDLTFARIERKTPVLRPAFQSNQSFLCGLLRSRCRGGGKAKWPDCQHNESS